MVILGSLRDYWWTSARLSLDGFCFPLTHGLTYIGAVLRRIILEKIAKIGIFAIFGKIVILELVTLRTITRISWCFADYEYVRKTLWEKRCEKHVVKKEVVRKTLWERRCVKDNPSMDFCWCSNLISYVFFSNFNCCWSSGGFNQFHWSTFCLSLQVFCSF